MTLATELHGRGLSWKIIDPGEREIRYWRKQLEALRGTRPRVVGISTTFIVGGCWLRSMFRNCWR